VANRVRSALSQAIWTEEAERLEQALESLEEHYREVILLRKFEELTYGEIAARLGKSEDACRMMFARAMTALTLEMEATS
jgi:RNA polymerase sigma-70 factor (ECF subfamily)